MISTSHTRHVLLVLTLCLPSTVLTQAPPAQKPEQTAQTVTAPSSTGPSNTGPSARRPARLSDAHEIEEIVSQAGFSPDGQSIVVVKRRAAKTQATNAFVIPNVRDDIWIQDAPGQPMRNITNGVEDASGWWEPQWSPDSQRLLFLSSRGGNVTPWVWDRTTKEVRQVSKRGVAHEYGSSVGLKWIDNTRFMCLAVRDGELSTPRAETGYYPGRGPERMRGHWDKVERGELTVSAIDSLEFKPLQLQLILVDAAKGTETVIGPSTINNWFPTWWVSPTAQAVAFVRPDPLPLSSSVRWLLGQPVSLDLRTLDGKPIKLDKPLPKNILSEKDTGIAWSPDGKEVAFFALDEAYVHHDLLFKDTGVPEVQWPEVASKAYPGRVWRVNIETGTVQQLDHGNIDLGEYRIPPMMEGTDSFGPEHRDDKHYFLWTHGGELVFPVLGPRQPHTGKAPEVRRWTVLARNGQTRPLVKDMCPKACPQQLLPIGNHAAFVGIAGGDLWRIDPVAGTRQNLTPEVADSVFMVRVFNDKTDQPYLWVQTANPKTDGERQLFKEARQGVPKEHAEYMIYPNSDDFLTPMPPPMPDDGLDGDEGMQQFSTESKAWTYKLKQTKENGADILWRVAPDGTAEQVLLTNTYQGHLVGYRKKAIEYTAMNGEQVKAMLTLPHNYQEGRRYPIVLDGDTGYTSLEEATPRHYDERIAARHPDLYEDSARFAAAGYIYMWVSMTTTNPGGVPERRNADNLLAFTSGITTALQKAIDLGYADPERAFLYGVSSMGYGVMGTITQTSRFKAAASGAGWVDQTTVSLSIDPPARSSENPFEEKMTGGQLPYSYITLPAWRNGDTLRRNSPLSYVDRIQTPLLLFHGEVDMVPIENVEMLFSALVQQRKPAQFLRYWGEGHGIYNPKNLNDLYQRIFAWFDRWGDISRDANGDLLFEGETVRSRGEKPPLQPEDFAKLDLFGPGGDEGNREWLERQGTKESSSRQ